jgi:hypothetical protein
MRKSCRWYHILIAVIAGVILSALGLFGALTDLNIVYAVVLGLAVISLALVYTLRRDLLRVDMKRLTYFAFTAILASVLGIIIDVLTLFELPLLFLAVAAVTLVLISDFVFIKFITQRGGG